MNTDLFGPQAMAMSIKARKKIIDEKRTVTVSAPGLRPGTTLPIVKERYVFAGAGMGDFICYMPAMIWIAKNCPWVDGGIFCPQIFVEFAENIMAPWKWPVLPAERLNELCPRDCVAVGPGLLVDGHQNHQLFTGTGGHLVTVGHCHFVNRMPNPEDCYYPEINFNRQISDIIDLKFKLEPKKYIVLMPGGLSDNRTVEGRYWGPIIDHIRANGLTPVFLGRTQMSPNTRVTFPDGCEYSKGIDLRDKTSMMEAAWIMKQAECVIGHDNGLIHLAACTDANIIASFGSVHPRERRPLRHHGRWLELFPKVESVPCAGCQTEAKRLRMHNFKFCIYSKLDEHQNRVQDLRCIDHLFAGNARLFTGAIDRIMAPQFETETV